MSNAEYSMFFILQVNSYQNKYTRESLSVEFVTCLLRLGENFQDAPIPYRKCAEQYEIKNLDVIEQCVNTTESSKLLQRHGETTLMLKPELTFVPTVVLKNVSSLIKLSTIANFRLIIFVHQ